MDHLVLYNRPKGDPWPKLQLVGELEGYKHNQAYSGRLQILNQRGSCTAALVRGSLPPGTVIWVDNPAKEVVIEFPGYSYVPPPPPKPDDPPPQEPERGLFNGDIEQGVKGWQLGPGWYVKTTPGPGLSGTKALATTYHGTSFAESDPVGCDPGTLITAEALWFQGPSNKRNVDLYTQLVWRDGGMRELRVDSGNKVHDLSNTSSHWSRVTATAPAGTAFASVRLLMYRRRYAREVVVDSVNWTHFKTSPIVVPPKPIKPTDPIPPPPPEYPEEFSITIGCWDAAGRYAEWVGLLGEHMIWLTSAPYPIIAIDTVSSYGRMSSTRQHPLYIEEMATSGALSIIRLESVVKNVVARENVATGGHLSAVGLRTVVKNISSSDEMRTTGHLTSVALKRVVVPYSLSDYLYTSGNLTGITLI